MKKTKPTPIKPSDVAGKIISSIPPEMIEAVNELILINYDGHSALFKQKDLEKLFLEKYPNPKEAKEKMYKEHWMAFENMYRKDWKVKFDGPGFNETYDATFEFIPRKKLEE